MSMSCKGTKFPRSNSPLWESGLRNSRAAGSIECRFLETDLVMKLTPKAPIPSVQDEFDQIYIRIPE